MMLNRKSRKHKKMLAKIRAYQKAGNVDTTPDGRRLYDAVWRHSLYFKTGKLSHSQHEDLYSIKHRRRYRRLKHEPAPDTPVAGLRQGRRLPYDPYLDPEEQERLAREQDEKEYQEAMYALFNTYEYEYLELI